MLTTTVSIDIAPHHRFQALPNSCAPACMSIANSAFEYKLPSELEIFKRLYDFYWDGTKPTTIEVFCQEQGVPFTLYRDLTLENAKAIIDSGAVAMALIFDFYESALGYPPEGHYIIIGGVDFKLEKIKVYDPAKEPRYYRPDGSVALVRNGYRPEIRASYDIRFKDFAWQDEVKPGELGIGYLLAFNSNHK